MSHPPRAAAMSHPPRAAAAMSHPPLASAHLPHRPLTSTASPLASACIIASPLTCGARSARCSHTLLAAIRIHHSPLKSTSRRRGGSLPLLRGCPSETHGSPTDCPNDCEQEDIHISSDLVVLVYSTFGDYIIEIFDDCSFVSNRFT
ncbi:hypothetical protein EJB05_40662, partial [Eragrostis curvula]